MSLTPAQQVAENVRLAMAQKRVTQAEMGRHLGLSQTSISKRLAGSLPFDVAEVAAVADRLEVPVEQLLRIESYLSSA